MQAWLAGYPRGYLVDAATAAIAAAGEEAAAVFAQLTETAKLAVLAKAFQTAKGRTCVMEKIFIVAREEAGVALWYLVGIIAPGKAFHEPPPHQKTRHRDKAQPDHHQKDKKELKDCNVPELHISSLLTTSRHYP